MNPSFPSHLGLILALAIPCSPAEEPAPSSPARQTLTLPETIHIALAHNPGLRASRSRVDAMAARAYQAGLWSNPELEFEVEEWSTSQGRGFPDAKQVVGVAQVLPFPGKKSLDRRVGGAGVRLSEANSGLLRLTLERDVKVAFYRVLAAGHLVETARRLVALAESSAETARRRVQAGAAPDQQALRAEIQLEQARNKLATQEQHRQAAKQALLALLGRPDLGQATFAGTLATSAEPGLLTMEAADWLASHPRLVGARTARDRARLKLRRARLEPYPDLTTAVAGGRLGETDESIIELRLSLPLPLIDRGKGQKQEASANLAMAQEDLARIRQELLRDWRIARERLRAAAKQVASYQDRILPKAESALQLVRGGFDQGKFDFIDLLDTQRTVAEARLDYHQRLLDLNIAQSLLESLVSPGEMTPPSNAPSMTPNEK